EMRTFRVTASPVRDPFGQVVTAIETFTDITESVRAEAQIRQAENKYRSIFENALEGIFQTTLEGRYLSVNPALARIYGYDSPEDLIHAFSDIASQLYVDPARREDFKRIMERDGAVADFRSQIRRHDGSVIWISENARLVRDPVRGESLYEGTVEDISAAIQAEEQLREQKAFFQELFESSPMAISMVDASGVIIGVNHSFEAAFGHTAEEIVGKRNRDAVVPERLAGEAEAFRRSLLKGSPVSKETERRCADGTLVPVELIGSPIHLGDKVVGAYYIYRDITERREFERQLAHQAFHDSLTALPNRSLYMERLRHAVERGRRREGYNFAVLMIDLNRFKRVNDTLGHHVGDQLLVGIALRILSCIRTVDTVARLGGDEFAVLLEEFESPREVIRVSTRIANILREPFTIEGHNVHSGASIGIVLHTRDYEVAEDILRDADIAMYQAKERGKSRLVFNKRMHAQAVEIGRMENELRTALAEEQFMLYYQPIVDVGSRGLQGFEALVRWNHPERGVVGPLEFIPLAEETGLIIPLGRWIIREACRQMSEWLRLGRARPDMSMSVNLSSRQFMQADLVDYVQGVLTDTGLPAANLKFEITESVIMQDAPVTSAKLARLKSLGIKIMIDDFGTGYSSLSYLQQFPVDYLKIDRSFISGAGDEQEKLEIVKTIVSLARNLGLGVVAEGVEREDQFDRLRSVNCENAQGYMFSRPVDKLTAEDMLRNWPGEAKTEDQ
ncbi:MAG: EAL domain-containing protein, partial [Desulfovibrionaceae bacterium]